MGDITLPSYGSLIDVYHENEVQEVLIVDEIGSPTKLVLIVWDDVSTVDQKNLTWLFKQYSFPATPIGGRQTIKLNQLGSPQTTGLRSNRNYTVTIHVTGAGSPNKTTTQTATIAGVPTLGQLATALNSAFTNVTVQSINGNLLFTTVSTGAGAKVEIDPIGTLFTPANSAVGFRGFTPPLVGVNTTKDVLDLNRNRANVPYSDRVSFVVRGRRPYLNRSTELRTEYFDSGSRPVGSPLTGVWRLLGTNVVSGSPATPPSYLV